MTSSCRFTSPERFWRAGADVLIAGWIAWTLVSQPAPALGLIVGWIAFGSLLVLAWLILRAHLAVDGAGLTDRRVFRVVRVPWQEVADFEVNRPGAMWGGFCVVVICRDGSTIDLLATRVYSRVPSGRHLDDVQRIAWTLKEILLIEH